MKWPVLRRLEGVGLVNPADATGDATPKWCQLFITGTRYRWDFSDGIDFNDAFFDSMLANFARAKTLAGDAYKLPIDYFHDEQGIAAGWILSLEKRDAGLFALIDWTDRARAAIQAKELQFLSPTFSEDGWDSTTGQTQGPTLYGAALLNTPFLFDLPRVEAGRGDVNPTPHQADEATKEKHMLKKLLLALGLPEDTTEEAALAAVKAGAVALTRKDIDVDAHVELAARPLRTELSAVKAENASLKSENEALKKKEFDSAINALVDEAVTAKKLLPASRDGVVEYARAVGLEKARKFINDLPGTVVPTGEKGIKGTERELSREEAVAEWNQKLDEKIAKGVSPTAAHKQLAAEFPQLLKATTKAWKQMATPTTQEN